MSCGKRHLTRTHGKRQAITPRVYFGALFIYTAGFGQSGCAILEGQQRGALPAHHRPSHTRGQLFGGIGRGPPSPKGLKIQNPTNANRRDRLRLGCVYRNNAAPSSGQRIAEQDVTRLGAGGEGGKRVALCFTNTPATYVSVRTRGTCHLCSKYTLQYIEERPD